MSPKKVSFMKGKKFFTNDSELARETAVEGSIRSDKKSKVDGNSLLDSDLQSPKTNDANNENLDSPNLQPKNKD